MKKGCFLFLTGLLLLGQLTVTAQNTDLPVRFANGNFSTGNNIQRQSFQKDNLQSSLFNDNYFVLVQFSSLPSPETKQALKNAGLELGTYIPGNAYFSTIKKDFDFSSIDKYAVISINTIPSFYKIDRSLLSYRETTNKDREKVFAVSYYTSVNRAVVIQELQKAGAVAVTTKFDASNVVFIRPSKNNLNEIAALPFVSFISLQSLIDKPLNYKSVGMHAVSSLLSPSGRNLRGKGITVGIGDNSEVSTAHIDFTGRVISRVPFPISFHGIHVTGTVAGGGLLDPKNNGMAPRATIVSQYLSDIISNTPTYVADYNMIATNNSYTAADDGCPGNGIYDVLSNYTDDQMKILETVLHVFSAGNDGTYTCSPYPISFATIKTGYQCAKNVLTVGAIDSNYVIAGFSSRGPVQDGRIKPEIVADGVNVFSTRQNNTYGNNSGTSMSGPVVAGAATLLNEQYRKLNSGATPKASLIKALLCNTAEDLGKPGPDFTFGFGNLNARRAAEAMEGTPKYFISSTAPSTNTISVPVGVRRLKVMLYWADPAAAANAASTLVNDLDLTVTAPGPITHLPLILNAANVNLSAAEGADHINNIEQVVIDNPVAGSYDLNVAAFAVPQGPQEYVLTYQMDMNGVTVEYPFGGETLVPGQTEFIRWSAYGDEGNRFTIEYYDGTIWQLISDTVLSTARSYNWVVPTTVSNNYLIRVSRNSSVYTDQSDYDFTVIGQPVVVNPPTVPCEGFVQLDWAAITGATSYDIWQLKGDTMAIIGNTASLSYLVQGLNSTTGYLFGVSAKNGTVNGRRSISRGALPSTGVCTLSDFDNNFKAVSIDSPVTKRQFTSSVLTATEKIKFTIKNLDNVASSGSYDLYYQINANPAVMETSSTVIDSLASSQYTFITTADLSAAGVYTIKAWVKRAGDSQVLDDTVSVIIKNLANPILILPLTDGFESTTAKDYTVNTMGLDGDDRVDFKTNTARGRARTFVNTGFALNGVRAITLDQFIYSAALTTDSLMMTYNLNNYTSGNQLRIDLYYKNHGQDNNPNNKVWIRGSDTKPWVLAYDLVANQAALGQWKHAVINVNDVLDTVLPAQPISTSFQMKIGEQGNTSANTAYPLIDEDDGYTFDDVTVKEAMNDIAITKIVSPSATGCGTVGSQPISIEIKNYSSTTFTDVPVYYSVNGNTVMETIASLPPGITLHVFAVPENLSVNTDYSFDFWLNETTDNYNLNDSILNYNFHTSPVINTFPYLEGFETGDGSWYSKGSNNSWQWGTPAKTTINKAANGTKAWVTSLTGNYKNNELSYLYSPCFDLSGLTQPVLSFSHIFEMEPGFPNDNTWIEYSVNGVSWSRLGVYNAPGSTNWYNDLTFKSQWGQSLATWHVASIDIPTKASTVRFRFVMASDMGYNLEGVGIDDIHVFDKALIYDGITPVTGLTQTVSGSSWIHFTSAGKRVASINANNNNLGSTTVDVYPYTGPVRISSLQYYLNRNIVIRPATQPLGDVSVRFYFTDAEAKSLLAATGCSLCSKPNDPYELGVTKYRGTAAEENGTLNDNASGVYMYVLPANTEIIPYDNGYYAEFPVNSFSEFWLNNGGVNGNVPLPVNPVSFDAIKQTNKVLLQWVTENEINANLYTVEKSADGINYRGIGNISAYNNSTNNYYTLTDMQPLQGSNYYRLKMIDRDGSFRYSLVRKINFDNAADDITIYPNPVVNSRIFIASSANVNSAVLYDAAGKMIRAFKLQGRNNTLDLMGIAKGIYQLKIFTDTSVHTHKIMIP